MGTAQTLCKTQGVELWSSSLVVVDVKQKEVRVSAHLFLLFSDANRQKRSEQTNIFDCTLHCAARLNMYAAQN